MPGRLVDDDLHYLVAQTPFLLLLCDLRVGSIELCPHRDEPLVDQSKDELGRAAPAYRVGGGVVLDSIGKPLLLEIGEYGLSRFMNRQSREPVEPVDEFARLIQWRDHRQPVFLAKDEILGPAAGRKMHDACAFFFAYFIPHDDAVGPRRTARDLRRELVEWARISPTIHLSTSEPGLDRVRTLQHAQGALAQIERLVSLADTHVLELWTDSRSDITRQRPWRRRPHEQALALSVEKREAEGDAGMGELLVSLGDDFVLAQPGAAAGAPGHHVTAFVYPPPIVTGFQGGPDCVVILIRKCEVRSTQLR